MSTETSLDDPKLVGGEMEGQTDYIKELTARDMSRMLVPERYWPCTLEGILDESDDGMSSREMARRYLARLEEFMDRGIGLLLWGANGRGKTGMAVVLAKWARRYGYKVLFMEAAELKRCVVERIAFDESETMLDRANIVDLLVLDDLGKGTQDSKGFGARIVDQLIRHRAANRRATVITTNMDMDQLREEMKASTIHSLKECIVPCQITGRDRRNESSLDLQGVLEG